jgi:hypothetical protein
MRLPGIAVETQEKLLLDTWNYSQIYNQPTGIFARNEVLNINRE